MTAARPPRLDSPLVLPSGLELSNRLVKSAMTEALAGAQRRPSEELMRLYDRWASSGAGLLITGNVGIDRDHPVRARDVILDDEADEERFRAWALRAKAGGARLLMQLNHAGRQTARVVNPRPLGPSAGAAVKMMHAFGEPRAASEAEIAEVIARHGRAAALAARAGFDGVQVHAAHGYLLNQFLAPDVNHRRDAWGGDVLGRARLLLECIRAARRATPSHFTVAVKLNSGDFLRGGFDEEDALEVVRLLEDEGIDLLEISGGRYESGASFGHATPEPGAAEAYFLNFARRARRALAAPLMLTGGLRSRTAMQRVLDEGTVDLIGIARPMATVPDYPRRLLAGEELPTIRPRRLGITRLESAAELAWYYAQLRRMGDGKDPAPDLSPAFALTEYMVTDAWEGARRHRERALSALRCPLRRPARLPQPGDRP